MKKIEAKIIIAIYSKIIAMLSTIWVMYDKYHTTNCIAWIFLVKDYQGLILVNIQFFSDHSSIIAIIEAATRGVL